MSHQSDIVHYLLEHGPSGHRRMRLDLKINIKDFEKAISELLNYGLISVRVHYLRRRTYYLLPPKV